MGTKIAAFNIENFFDRAAAFNEPTDDAQSIIRSVAKLNELFEKPRYDTHTKSAILAVVDQLGLNRFLENEFMRIRKIRGSILRFPRDGSPPTVIADGRDDWVGWAEHKTVPVDEIAVENTARVIRDVDADILAVVEAENRVVLERFTTAMLNRVVKELPSRDRSKPYDTYMLIDGNDDRGIDVGLMTKPGYEIDYMRSHINDRFGRGLKKVVYSRDCPEFGVITPEEEWIWVLPNHFKSKFGGNDAASQQKRKAQAKRTKEIYEELIDSGEKNVVVLGDLNDTPDSSPLQPLLNDTDLRDIGDHPVFDSGEWPGVGTYGLGNDNDKIDYLLLSPELFERVTAGGLFRKGAWPGSRPVRWDTYPEITEKIHVASDHHVIWAEIE